MTTITTNIGTFANLYSLYTEMRLNKITEVEILEYSYCCDNLRILCGKWSFEDIQRAYLGRDHVTVSKKGNEVFICR